MATRISVQLNLLAYQEKQGGVPSLLMKVISFVKGRVFLLARVVAELEVPLHE